MIPYDQVDKTEWVTIEFIWDDEFIDKLKKVANLENRTVEDWVSKTMYEWWQKELESDNLKENYTKIEIPISNTEENKNGQ
jgi:hypothetical protein